MRTRILIFFLLAFHAASAQYFKNGDRVVFSGNSITHNGDYWHNVALYYATRFPAQNVQFFNGGISGDVASGMIRRLQSDILSHQPTHVVVMIGMNDVNRPLYDPRRKNEPGIREKQQEAIAAYKRNLDSLVTLLLAAKVKVILQTPSIYDQTSKMAGTNNFGANDGLRECGEFVKSVAKKHKLPLVDYWGMMVEKNKLAQSTDSTATIVSKDRVHPAGPGHLLMGWEWLRTMKSEPFVSYMVIDKTTASSQGKSKFCRISDLKRDKKEISFMMLESALPFPLRADQQAALQLAPVINDISREMLFVHYIEPGNYTLYIDDEKIGTWFSGTLERGLNLAELTGTPQYRQALEVQKHMAEAWKLEKLLRDIKLVEHRFAKDLDAFTANPGASGLDSTNIRRVIAYQKNKPREAEIVKAFAEASVIPAALRTPVPHRFRLVKE